MIGSNDDDNNYDCVLSKRSDSKIELKRATRRRRLILYEIRFGFDLTKSVAHREPALKSHYGAAAAAAAAVRRFVATFAGV